MIVSSVYFKDSAVSLSISIMLLAAGFFGFFSFTCTTSPFILDAMRARSISCSRNGQLLVSDLKR